MKPIRNRIARLEISLARCRRGLLPIISDELPPAEAQRLQKLGFEVCSFDEMVDQCAMTREGKNENP